MFVLRNLYILALCDPEHYVVEVLKVMQQTIAEEGSDHDWGVTSLDSTWGVRL